MKRRDFLKTGFAITLPMGLGTMAFAQDGTVFVYTGADANWPAPTGWSKFIVSTSSASGPLERMLLVRAGGIQANCAA